jgi:hypothetical protein
MMKMKDKTNQRIRRVSAILKWLFIIAMVVVPLLYVSFWAFDSHIFSKSLGLSVIPAYPVHSLGQQLPVEIRIVGFCVSLVPMIFFIVKMVFLVKLFALYERGIIFAIGNVRNIRRLGWTMLLWEVANPFYQLLLTFVISSNNPPGHRFVSISWNNIDVSTTIMAVIILVVSWIMREGVRLEEQQRLTV